MLGSLLLWLLSRALAGGGGWAIWPLSGVVVALACLTRGNLLLLVPLLVVWLLLRAPDTGEDPVERLGRRLRSPTR